MTPLEFARKYNFKIQNTGNGNIRNIKGVFCCDLLSVVMGRAQADYAWITVMGNINSIAVALLSDVSCIILSEGMNLDNEAIEKAIQQDICVISSELPTYEIALLLNKELI